jgi:hypothetical protein
VSESSRWVGARSSELATFRVSLVMYTYMTKRWGGEERSLTLGASGAELHPQLLGCRL